ncbi:MAG: mycofactocin precursor MftA [Sandaracinaceae bacterium]
MAAHEEHTIHPEEQPEAEERPTEGDDSPPELLDEVLIEVVGFDGMCGVY